MPVTNGDQLWILNRADPYVLHADDGWVYFLATVALRTKPICHPVIRRMFDSEATINRVELCYHALS